MYAHGRNGGGNPGKRDGKNNFRLAPVAGAIALMLTAGGAYAAQPFSAGWYAAKGALQETARTTGMVNGKPVSSLTNPAVQQQQANAQLQQSIANLGLAARSIALQQASQAMQHAALLRDAPSVPDGLGVNGLDTGSLVASWINANGPTQTTDANGKVVVGITQTTDKAIANWESFNVGKNTIVQFNQASSDWAILNRIVDPSMAPSQIQGQIRASGTVLILNKNGIVFSGTSQINTRNLVAAAADITDSQFNAGGIYSPLSGVNYVPAFTNANGNLIVEQGAQITTSTPASATQGGGYVLLMGKNVTNSGDIETPKGQVALAAGDSFIIRKGVGTDANQSSTTRGNEISPQFVPNSTAGQVINTKLGLLYSREGDITLAGHDVQQNGVAVATTDVNTRGTIHLLNSASDATGSVTLGSGAMTTIVLDDDGATALNSQRDALIADSLKQDPIRLNTVTGAFDNLSKQGDREDQSRIEIVTGGDVNFAGGSLTLATGGQIAVTAGHRTFAATGSILDVSGAVGVNLAMASNNVVVNVQGNELRDSPDNRDSGTLFNSNITVDRRDLILVKGDPALGTSDRWYTAGGLLEVSGYLNNQAHGIGEWAAQGGTIQLGGKEVITQTGSQLNVSGGTLNVATGYVAQTWLVGSDGQLYNADNAPTGMTFAGVYKGFEVSHTRWGADAAEFYYNPLIAPKQRLENGYTVGRDAGQLIVDAPTAVLEGNLTASVYNGPQQVRGRDAVDGYAQAQTAVAQAGALSLGLYRAGALFNTSDTDIRIDDIDDITSGMSEDTALPAGRINTSWLDASRLNAEGLGELDLAGSRSITVAAPLVMHAGGIVNLMAPVVDLAADLTGASGSVRVANMVATAPSSSSAGMAITVDDGVTIDTRGLWVNGLNNPDSLNGLAWLNGGNVILDANGDLTLSGGSVIDVSSGGAILPTGKTQGGRGGNVTLVAGEATGGGNSSNALAMNGVIRAWGVAGGGTLTINAPGSMVFGDMAQLQGTTLVAGTPAPLPVQLAQPLTIAAGQLLPFDLVQTHLTVAYDEPMPATATLGGLTGIPTGADWLVPDNMYPQVRTPTGGVRVYNPGTILPMGSVISGWGGDGTIPAGTVIPAAVFVGGLPVVPYQVVFAAGTHYATDMTYTVGTVLPTGTVLPQNVSLLIAPAINFAAGFANYDITAGLGIQVMPHTSIAPVMPVYQFGSNSAAAPSGSDPGAAMSLWLPPLETENPVGATLTQRGGAGIALHSVTRSLNNSVLGGGDIIIGENTAITVDPGQSIRLDAFGQITVDGTLSAHGGSISVFNERDGSVDSRRNFDADGSSRGVSVWLGEHALLDVSGQSAQAVDALGRTYGQAGNGGSIALDANTAFLVVRPGAELNADGAGVTVGLPAGGTAALAGNGGAIELSSGSGLYLDGSFHARGAGAGAADGSLTVSLLTPNYGGYSFLVLPPPQRLVPSVMTVEQTSAATSLLPDDIAPGTDLDALQFGQATIAVDKIEAGGFGTLSLKSGDYMVFSGDVRLAMRQSLTLSAAAFTSGAPIVNSAVATATPTSNSVVLSAPYMLLQANPYKAVDGTATGTIGNPRGANIATTASFEADAAQLDVQGLLIFSASASTYDATAGANVATQAPGFHDVRLVSSSDLRFLPPGTPNGGTLYSPWDITLLAAQIYPASGVRTFVTAGLDNGDYAATLTLGRTTDTIPDAPMSVLGDISFSAPIVRQGGIVRAPFGKIRLGGTGSSVTGELDLLPGSLTSVSMDGMTIPYGGTIDGVTYTYNGSNVVAQQLTGVDSGVPVIGIDLDARAIDVSQGATLDLSGGGTLTGAGFVSGRGGSVNILNTPLINANPTAPVSRAGDKVYAIVPGFAASYAPVAPENGMGDPVIGQRVTIGAGVPGLPAGTYTLLPSNYALLPGAYRVEIAGPQSPRQTTSGTVAAGNGLYVTSGTLGIANTDVVNSTPSTLLVMPASQVRHYSQFNEQGYDDFLLTQASQFGKAQPMLPADGKALVLNFETPATPGSSALSFDGNVLLQADKNGFAGQVVAAGVGEIVAGAPTPGFTGASVSADALNALQAPRLSVNGYAEAFQIGSSQELYLQSIGNTELNIRDGVTLQAAELFLMGSNIHIGQNVTLSTIGRGNAPFDSVSTGLPYVADQSTVLALSNGELDFIGAAHPGQGSITVGAGSDLYAGGTLAFGTNGSVSLDPDTHFGARNISLAVGNLNIGSTADLTAGNAPDGLTFNQALFDALLHGDTQHGAPALAQLTLSATAINLFGTTSLDARGSGVDLVLAAPAIYGFGGAGDQATIAADRIVWKGITGQNPPAITAGGPGTGSGSFTLAADEIELGQFVHLDTSSTSRVTYGFANVNLTATGSITAAGNTSLSVYQAPSTVAGDVFGKSGTGGNLTLNTPLLTGVQKSIASYTAGGVLSVAAPDSVAPSTADTSVAGAEIDLNGNSVNIGSTILLPSGKLAVKAVNDISLQDGSRIDLSGQPTVIQRATVYGFGGMVSFDSAQGNITQTASSVIDVSATQANAGSVTATAASGHVALGGSVQGSADSGFTSADFSATAATIDDFDGLNARLTQGGVFDARSFDVKSGDLTIGDGVKARNVTVSVDDGNLTVNGKIDASGAAPGTIRLSAMQALTLAATSMLDAHGTQLQVDSYGQAIEAKNRGNIELTAVKGTLTLGAGSTMDVSAPDGVARGQITLNAQRGTNGIASAADDETAGDIRIDAAGPLNIRGAYAVALNAMWTYDLPGGSVITQATLDGYDAQNLAFMDAAYGGNVNAGVLTSSLQGKLGGLQALGNAFHLRPGVEITSSGDLSTSGDIDLSHYRYGPNANRDLTSDFYGAGEAMALTVRAAGNLTVKGSISDGFGPLPAMPGVDPVYSGVVASGSVLSDTLVFTNTIYFTTSWVVPSDDYYNFFVGYLTDYSTGINYYPGNIVPPGAQFSNDGYNSFEAGVTLPGYATGITTPGQPATLPLPPVSPMAALLAAGSQSASLRLVAGADTSAADPRTRRSLPSLQGSGNLSFNDPNYDPSLTGTYVSVVRTGTGSLDLMAGGNFSVATPYGIYTAGTQSAPVLAADGSNPYDLPGKANSGHAWYPEQGGDVLVAAQGDVSGNIQMNNNVTRFVDSTRISNWLWMQGGAGVTADPAAWWINFGVDTRTSSTTNDSSFVGFQGIGTLGGGNLSVIAGRNAGTLSNATSSGLNLVVASTGRMLADGTLLQTGGGDLLLSVGGTINPLVPGSATQYPDYFGTVTNLRGNINISASAIGEIAGYFGSSNSVDPRALDPSIIKFSMTTMGPIVVPGDGQVRLSTRGDLVFGGAGDAGMSTPTTFKGVPYTQVNADGSVSFVGSQGVTHFSLWTPTTAISLYSAGGDVAPQSGFDANSNANGYFPASLTAAAVNGDLRLSGSFELMPAANGQLALLAAGSIYGSNADVSMSGADPANLATPWRPMFTGGSVTNRTTDAANRVNAANPLAFGEDTPTTALHADDTQAAMVYAGLDIDDLTIGKVATAQAFDSQFRPEHQIWYTAAKPFQVIAGRDIVGTGPVASAFVNVNPADVTLIQVGRDIIDQSVTIAGPGVLQVQAGRNLYQGYLGSFDSAGLLYGVNASTRAGGADIAVMVGVGAKGPDYADFAKLYLDAANQADITPGHPLADQPGKVAQTYDQQLDAWLQQRFGYTGSPQDALAYFLALPPEQQGVFVRQVYYAELTAGGREYNDPDSTRFQSYLRGRQAIATLFPTQDAQGNAISYDGNLTMFSANTVNSIGQKVISDAGIHTDFGGSIQILNPGGTTLIGIEGITAGPGAGLITQGEGDIDVYSAGSILLGQSRIMTTFGGAILAWSATGDINAGRGSKTTIVFTPPRRVYDDLGDVTISPNVPSSGAGIATLAPIPEVPAGDVDLIAPLGTIDAGEAGIRVSGNVNLAALQVVNAANIQVQGKSTGLPLVATVNVNALTNASAAATQAAMAAQDVVAKERTAARQSLPSIFTVRVLGFGNDPVEGGSNASPSRPDLQSNAGYDRKNRVQIAGHGPDMKPELLARLTDDERRKLSQDQRDRP